MQFITNTIMNPAGTNKTPDFGEWLQNHLQKLANGEAKPGTGIDNSDEPRGAQRGQVINNDNEEGTVQERKSDGKKESKNKQSVVKAECGKDMGENSNAGKVTEKHDKAGPGNDENPNPKVLINNDPNYQKGESTNLKKKKKEAKNKQVKLSKVASMPRLDKLLLFANLSANKEYLIGPRPLAYIEAMVGLKFANMTEEEKSWFKDYWKTMYGDAGNYVEEMVKDR